MLVCVSALWDWCWHCGLRVLVVLFSLIAGSWILMGLVRIGRGLRVWRRWVSWRVPTAVRGSSALQMRCSVG